MVRGKRVAKTFDTKAEAEEFRIDMANTVAVGTEITNETVGFLAESWLEQIEATKDETTHATYQYAIQPFQQLYTISALQLRAINIQKVLNGLSGRKAQMSHDKIRQCLKWAVRMKLLSSDPSEGIERPSHERKAIEVFNLEEIPVILESSEHLRYAAAIRLALSIGLRGAEVWGLKWSDWNGNELSVNRQAAERSGVVTIKPPKKNSFRTLYIPDSVTESIEARNAARVREGLASCEWMFPDSKGNVTRRSNFAARTWKPLLKDCGLPSRGFHHCRHTAASVLLNSGVPITVVARILGHKDAATTLSIYAHLMTSELETHRNQFDRIFRAEVG